MPLFFRLGGPEMAVVYISSRGGACEGAVFSYDLSTESIEQITPLREMYGWGLAVSHISDKIAYETWEWDLVEDTELSIIHLSDLQGNQLDSFVLYGYAIRQMRFSESSDTLLYITVRPDMVLRLNLNTGGSPDTLLYAGFNFDLFPQDSAFLMLDTIFSLTSGNRTGANLNGYYPYANSSINPQNPNFVALAGVIDTTTWENHSWQNETEKYIAVVDITTGTGFEIPACPEDKRGRDYRKLHSCDFSPDGNSIVYLIDSYQDYSSRTEIGLITNVFDD
ncbi:hypothetical protein ES703_00873 [subsurface metagenome]